MKIEKYPFTIQDYKEQGARYAVLTDEGEKVRILCLNAKREKNIIALVTNKDGKEEVRDYDSDFLENLEDLKLVEYVYENGDFVTVIGKNGKEVGIVKSYDYYNGRIESYHYSRYMDCYEKKG